MSAYSGSEKMPVRFAKKNKETLKKTNGNSTAATHIHLRPTGRCPRSHFISFIKRAFIFTSGMECGSTLSGISSDNIPISQSKRSDKYLLPSSVANQPTTFRASSGEALLSSTLSITDSSIFIIYFFCIFIITPHHNKSMSTFQTIKLIHITGNHIIKDSISLRRAFIACV